MAHSIGDTVYLYFAFSNVVYKGKAFIANFDFFEKAYLLNIHDDSFWTEKRLTNIRMILTEKHHKLWK